MSPEERKILEIVTDAANAGEPCPTNTELADRLGFKSHSGPLGALQRLQKRGLITLERFQVERRVTINATGKRTKVYNTQPHWRDIPDFERAENFPPLPRMRPERGRPRNVVSLADEAARLPRVSRDPCFHHCGARGDVGCGRPTAGVVTFLRFPQGAI